uniref:Uncharacterized protein n=1 Tax=Chromera velia CCMP2878 TaxID=1169474 RepID=A0A0G4HNG3_9ALVE|eukprot:Cvel_29469.t1-p1 / transcript=Cvel_29469.t1 / gene=Cvel_29469 / organism=Chromera_velia_CCMP2878 / gene_product=hypothetical protein / transcript_product=hypothetical protein / location=Cvel_scaffold4038:7722-9639(+) / protein_length=440 / sequence_SO=supercontig / SO=protein_coding / is_pseudo=false
MSTHHSTGKAYKGSNWNDAAEAARGEGKPPLVGPRATDPVSNIDVTVLTFANWLTEMRNISNTMVNNMVAEMGVIRNGIQTNQADLNEFKHQAATVQQQMQKQISDIKNDLSRTFSSIAQCIKSRAELEQRLNADTQGLREILQFKQLEIETLRKTYNETNSQLHAQVANLSKELAETRLQLDELKSQHAHANDQSMRRIAEIESSMEVASASVEKTKQDHSTAVTANEESTQQILQELGRLMSEWRDWQRLVESNQQGLQKKVWEMEHRKQAIDTREIQQIKSSLLADAKAAMSMTSTQSRMMSRAPTHTHQPGHTAAAVAAAAAVGSAPQTTAPAQGGTAGAVGSSASHLGMPRSVTPPPKSPTSAARPTSAGGTAQVTAHSVHFTGAAATSLRPVAVMHGQRLAGATMNKSGVLPAHPHMYGPPTTYGAYPYFYGGL